MKKIIATTCMIVGICLCAGAQQIHSENYSTKVAKRLRDSLSLSEDQRISIYSVNMQLGNQKAAVWQQTGTTDSLMTIQLQAVENTRDSLYRPILGEEKFLIYKSKKKNLITNN